MDDAMRLVAELLAALVDAHSPRAIVRAIAETLATRAAVVRVELEPPAPPAVAVLEDGAWRCSDPAASATTRARRIAPGLAVVVRGDLPAYFEAAAFRDALAQVVAAAVRHHATVMRVAQSTRKAHAEARELRADLDRLGGHGEIVARSAAMRAVLRRVELVARHATSVLLVGESGTGKDVLARELHRKSPRAHRPMVQLNCGALPAGLVESELFGHERGAFTGAERAHVGAFERAHRGTLFLDEIGELSPAAQTKLLRVLQERRVRRVGGETEIDVDVRLVAATHRPLLALVEQGAFREDLYYRLDVFTIALPPLRERRGDLAPLAAALVRELAAKLHLPVPALTRATLARLAAHDWPGNVRELMNTLESAMILGGGLSLALPDALPQRPKREAVVDGAPLDASIRAAIEAALRACRGKLYGVGGAAERLGLPPGTLQSKMRKLGIDRTRFV